jgi:hypothetical protein
MTAVANATEAAMSEFSLSYSTECPALVRGTHDLLAVVAVAAAGALATLASWCAVPAEALWPILPYVGW